MIRVRPGWESRIRLVEHAGLREFDSILKQEMVQNVLDHV